MPLRKPIFLRSLAFLDSQRTAAGVADDWKGKSGSGKILAATKLNGAMISRYAIVMEPFTSPIKLLLQ